jgi:AcrR family transcriptional regulator
MPPRPRFTLSEIQEHALEIVDRDGVGGLSMRALASSLGTGAMTLYNYLDNRAALEELVVDAVTAKVKLPLPTADWAEDVHAVALALWQAGRAHPAAIPLVLTRRSSSISSLVPAEALIDALSRGGLEDLELLGAFRTVMGFVMGIAQAELAGPLSPDRDKIAEATRIESLAASSLPHVAALARVSQGSNPLDEFEQGLNFILRGLQARRGITL